MRSRTWLRRRWRWLAGLAAALGGALQLLPGGGARLGLAPATACSCANWTAPTHYPYPGDPAPARPRNTRLRLTPVWNLPGYGDWEREHGFDGKRWNVELVKVGTSTPIPIDQRVVGGAEERVLEVWPKSPLEANASYELRRGGGVARTSRGFPTMRVGFATGAEVDSTAPVWRGPKSARYLPGGVVTGYSCDVKAPVIEIDVGEASDDVTPPAQIVYGVWLVGASPPDYAAAPAVVVAPSAGRVILGRASYCAESNFAVKDERMRFGLRALDWAGNASAPSEITVGEAPRAATPTDGPTGAPPSSRPPPAPATGTTTSRRMGGCGVAPGLR